MKTLRTIGELKDKKVLLRVDFDVPVKNGKILERFKLDKQRETVGHLIKSGAKVIMVAHISDVDSFSGLLPQLHLILGHEVNFLKKIEDIGKYP